MTLNIYSHVLPAMQGDAVEKLDELLIPIEGGIEMKKLKEAKQLYSAQAFGCRNYLFWVAVRLLEKNSLLVRLFLYLYLGIGW